MGPLRLWRRALRFSPELMRLTCFIVLAVLTQTGCRARHESPPAPIAPVVAEPPLPKLAANDAAIALGNLDGQIKDLEAREDRSGKLAAVEMLAMRGQFLGCIADYDKALAIA